MILGVQIFGVLFSLVMIYYIFLQHKKNIITLKELLLWKFIFIVFMAVMLFPGLLNIFTARLNLERRMDFIMMAGLVFLTGFAYWNHIQTKKIRKDIIKIVSKIALKKK